MSPEPHDFEFAFEPAYRVPAAGFGVLPATTWVRVDATHLSARFGPWRIRTALFNIVGVRLTGPYTFVKTAGPARLTPSDRGLTFATNHRQGVQIDFHAAIAGIEPTGRLRHPNLTVTVADCAGLVSRLAARA